jgi:GT2 family glycosyltransferase
LVTAAFKVDATVWPLSTAPPTCAVVIPSFNSAKFIDIALNSLVSQTRKPDDVIVVDAGSTDRTEEITRSFADVLNIQFLVAPKTTQGQARNVGIRAARSELVCFLDSDDIFLSRHIEIADRIFAAHPDTDAVRGYQVQWNSTADTLELNYDFHRTIDNEVEIFESSINLSTLTIRRNLLMDRGILFADNLRGRYCEDWDFCVRLLASGIRMRYIAEPVSVVTERSGSHTRKSIFWKMRFLLLRTLLDNQSSVAARRSDDANAIARIATGVDSQRFKAAVTMLAAGRPRMARRLTRRLQTPKYRLIAGLAVIAARVLPGASALFTWLGTRMGGYGRWRPRKSVTLPGEPALLDLRRRWLNKPSLA